MAGMAGMADTAIAAGFFALIAILAGTGAFLTEELTRITFIGVSATYAGAAALLCAFQATERHATEGQAGEKTPEKKGQT